jgi:predicted GNAT superfamily acetyltransferase
MTSLPADLPGAQFAPAHLDFRELHSTDEMVQANNLLDTIWKSESSSSHFDPALLTALSHSGNYVVGVYDGEAMVAVCVGFFATPLGNVLHSHIAGVRADHADQGLGRALKLHQRQWCLDRGISTITWTFDPLVSRNAYFNISRLGAQGEHYFENFYGSMNDKVNVGQSSDRMVANWSLAPGPPIHPASISAEGLPVALWVGAGQEPCAAAVPSDTASAGEQVAIGVPHDIESLRKHDPALAHRWRLALRGALAARMNAGWKVTGFDKSSFYTLERPLHEN